jgi:hypothetical protein
VKKSKNVTSLPVPAVVGTENKKVIVIKCT